MKIKNQTKDVAYIATLLMLQGERKTTLSALDIAINACERKEIRLPDAELKALRDLRSMVVEMRPKDKPADKTTNTPQKERT